MFMCVVHQKSVNKLDFTWKQSFLIHRDLQYLKMKTLSKFAIIFQNKAFKSEQNNTGLPFSQFSLRSLNF